MNLSVTTAPATEAEADWLIAAVSDSKPLSDSIQMIDNATDGMITRAVARSDFPDKLMELLPLYQARGIAAENILLVGLGTADQCSVRHLRHALLAALRTVCTRENQSVAVCIDERVSSQQSPADVAELFADCVTSASSDADLYKAKRARWPIAAGTLHQAAAGPDENAALKNGRIIGSACNLVRELVNRTPNELNPETFAARAVTLASESGLEVSVFEEDQLQRERMGALLAVARGSSRPPRMVKLSYRGAGSDAPVLALVGKGVTFDSGGYSLKPTDSMISMKSDMAGAATVLGAIVAAAQLRLPVNVSAYLGLVENMISGDAYRLGDVLTARNGTTIEVHNTDAEGRLVLADVLDYAVDDGADRVIDLATLTGACVVALGEQIIGLFSNSETLTNALTAAADRCGEFVWPMPMHEHFEPLLKSSVADCKNVGPRWGGAVTAAKFLEKFVGTTPWTHLDIAGPSWADSSSAWQDSGGTGACLRTLIQMLR